MQITEEVHAVLEDCPRHLGTRTPIGSSGQDLMASGRAKSWFPPLAYWCKVLPLAALALPSSRSIADAAN